MTGKLMVAFVVAFVILTVIVAVLSARKGHQRRPSPLSMPTSNTLSLDTAPPKFPEQ